MKNLIHLLTSRLVIVGTLIFIQVLVLVMLIINLSSKFVYVYGSFTFLSLIIVLWIVNKNENPSVKLPWIITIMLFPVFGGLFYVFFGFSGIPNKELRQMDEIQNRISKLHIDTEDTIDEILKTDPHICRQVEYIKNMTGMPPYKNTKSSYLPTGEIYWETLKNELKKAESFIFMEYFIVEEGRMWNELLDILNEKAKEGIEVRFMYDDIGCVKTLPYKYNEKLEAAGIKCVIFNPFEAKLAITANNRDHRKITVIDGNVGFTGGVNLADEYINEIEKHGHWKDCGIILNGDAVWNLTLIFLSAWNFYRPTDTDYTVYRPKLSIETYGYVQPFMDTPLDGELVGETVYLNIINNATKYLYINTPYLIVDNELVTALSIAAKKGVDVRIVTPYVADKWYVHLVTQAYYPPLIHAGVKIYEYTPGFIHSKTFLADDEIGVVGTINMDYRSLYHHFECGTLLYKTSSLDELKKDCIDIFNVSKLITEEDCRNVSFVKRFMRGIIRMFSPLM